MNRFASALVILSTIALAGSVVAIILVTNQRRAEINTKLSRQHETQHLICVAVNKLYKSQRQAAIDNYSKLDRNGKLLQIKITPALRRAAKQGELRSLRQFADQPC